MAFRLWADDGPFIVVCRSSLPSLTKKPVKIVPPLTKLSGSTHVHAHIAIIAYVTPTPTTRNHSIRHSCTYCNHSIYAITPYVTQGAQWLSGRVLDSRPRGHGFESHRRHCVVSFSKNINLSLVLVQPRKTRPFIRKIVDGT